MVPRMSGRRVRVAVVFGGRSTEHAISCVSAGSVLAALDPDVYEVVPVGITPKGAWVITSGDPATLRIDGRMLPTVENGTAVVLPGDPTAGGLVVVEPGAGARLLHGVDVVFPVLHGPYGEDGTIQGLLEMAGVPYVGSGVLGSAVAMDKEFTKKLLLAEGLPVGPYTVVRAGGDAAGRRARAAGAAGLRQAGPRRLLASGSAGSTTGPTCRRRSRPPARSTPRCSSRPRCRAGRSSWPCWRASTARPRTSPSRPRSGCSAAGSGTTSRPSTSTTSPSCRHAGGPARRGHRAAAGAGGAGVHRAGLRRAGPGRLLRRAGRRADRSTRSTRCRASPRSRCSRRRGPSPGCRYPALLDRLIRTALSRRG